MKKHSSLISWKLIPGILCFLMVMPVFPVHARDKYPPEASTITVFIENDVTDNTDWWYTGGAKVTWISPDLIRTKDQGFLSRWANSWMDHLPLTCDHRRKRTFSLSVGQNIYTPKDRETSQPILDDRPYAGLSYLSLGLHARDAKKMDTIEVVLGIVGPHSYAEQSQRLFHEFIRNHQPQGWDNQLKDEPVLNINVDRKWRLLRHPNGTKGHDVIPYAGILLGNAVTAVNAGAEFRFGCIPNDFGTYMIGIGNNNSNAPLDSTDPRYSDHIVEMHLFAGVDTWAILRTIVLDGNTFKESQSIDKKPFVANLFAGIGLTFHKMKFTYAQVYRTKEFEGQDKEQFFGSLTVSRSF